ncbi:unnamed protein product [Effrenium voratum]|uniref:Uncharacterized protein n=1 Tax=Effrenium voratum TaxID=2562239 RepID=A0AA36JRF8_9DINO|nr:unnamed protein product [Effrenium voratum]
MAWRLAILIYAWRCVAIRDGGTDHIGLDDPVFTISKMLEKDAKDDADYMDCLQRWESERRKQIAFLSGFNHLVSAKRRVQRLHISMRTLGHSRNVTLLVSELHQGLSWLSSASVKYAERLKMYVDSLHPRLSEQCKRSTFRADDLRDEIVGVVGARRRSATLATMTMDARRRAVPERRSGFGRFLHTTPAPKIVEPTRPAREQELKVTTSEVPDVVVTSPVKLRQKPEANSTKSNGTEGNTTKAITTEANSTEATRTEATNNGTQANSTQANGTASKSTQTTDAANGTKTNGTAANSTKATSTEATNNGTQANGTQATDAANSTQANGTAANDTKAINTEANSTKANGTDGTQANGTQANRTTANGTAANGTKPTSTATDAANRTTANGTAANGTASRANRKQANSTEVNSTEATGTEAKTNQASAGIK